MAERMRAGTRRYAGRRRVLAKVLSSAAGRAKREAAHVVIPVLATLAAAAVGAFLFENEIVGTLVGAVAGFLFYLVGFGLLNYSKTKRAVESEHVPSHDDAGGAHISLNLDVSQEAPHSELSCVVVDSDGHEVMAARPPTARSRKAGGVLNYAVTYPDDFEQKPEFRKGEEYRIVWWTRGKKGDWLEVARYPFMRQADE